MDGILITPLKRIHTERGDVLHAMKNHDPGYAGFGEAYFSIVLPGTIKGWKRHSKMTLNLIVPCGTIRFVAYDDRRHSPNNGCFQEIILSPDAEETYSRLTVGPGMWLAFQGQANGLNVLLNVADIHHDPAEAENRPLDSIPWSW